MDDSRSASEDSRPSARRARGDFSTLKAFVKAAGWTMALAILIGALNWPRFGWQGALLTAAGVVILLMSALVLAIRWGQAGVRVWIAVAVGAFACCAVGLFGHSAKSPGISGLIGVAAVLVRTATKSEHANRVLRGARDVVDRAERAIGFAPDDTIPTNNEPVEDCRATARPERL